MGILIGRDAELAHARGVAATSKTEGLTRAIRISGFSGTGKTATAAAIAECADSDGWLVVRIACHRIQANLPLFLARRVIERLVAKLGDSASRYTAGTGAEIDPAATRTPEPQEALPRLLEGVTLDHCVLLSIDDAQWADVESRQLIAQALGDLADRPILLLSTERTEDVDGPAFAFVDAQIQLGDLPAHVSAEIVRAHFPGANEQVVASIVEHAGGRAIDIVSLAAAARENTASNADDVAANMRTMVARDVGLLSKEAREFLQICSLISEPIDYAILQQIWPDDSKLMQSIEHASGRYLTQEGSALRFAHAAVAQSVRETIAIEIPFRRRIVAAIEALPHLRLEDHERLVEQATASGDHLSEHAALLRLCEAANVSQAMSLVADASERALAIAQPSTSEFIPFFLRLAAAYNLMGRLEDNIRALRGALARADDEKIVDGTGAIVAALLVSEWFNGDRSAVDALLAFYQERLTAPADRAQLLSIVGFIALNERNPERLEQIRAELDSVGPLPSIVEARMLMYDGMMKARLGRFEEADAALRTGRNSFRTFPPSQVMFANTSRLITFFQTGSIGMQRTFGLADDPARKSPVQDNIRLAMALAAGDGEEVLAKATAVLGRSKDRFVRLSVNGVLATSHVLLGTTLAPSVEVEIESDARYFESRASSSTIQVAAAWSAILAERDAGAATRLIELVLDRLSQPIDPDIILFPVVLPIAASRAGATPALRRMIQPSAFGEDEGVWKVEQRRLAALVARSILEGRDAQKDLDLTAHRFSALGATLFVQLAKGGWKERLGGTNSVSPIDGNVQEAVARAKATRREREVAALVAEGITNREIAERLFLSERTIEAHLANLFAKVNVNSRTQLAAWYLTTTAPVA